MSKKFTVPASEGLWLGEDFVWEGRLFVHHESQFEYHSRWSVDFREVYLRDDGTFWGAVNRVPATESQDFDDAEDILFIRLVPELRNWYVPMP